uniref:Ras-related protein RABF2b-like n=1 Tax=Ciona intestinalis TaxID=7719 RepID=H2XVX8_CIOIN|nr:ras-related protein RABF2b-like [Ciona intestinalis]|eukprot:XP_009858857.2 ras-related protein RABF2b-like [Ciona intestinalis]
MKNLSAKVLVLGDQGVGKTSLVMRYSRKIFVETSTPTIGAAYFEAIEEVGDQKLKLKIWDTAGQERFKSMIPMYYRNSKAALIVFDITDSDSFVAAQKWATELHQHIEDKLILFLIGNKSDLGRSRKVKQSEANAYAEMIGGHFREVSAYSNEGISEMFLDLCVKLLHEKLNSRRNTIGQVTTWPTNDSLVSSQYPPIEFKENEAEKNTCCFTFT